jgi:DNA-binding winged helix-turn-helix (wHTH) protein
VRFLFADHTLDSDRRELRRGADAVAVEPQVFDLLIYLVQNRDRVVSKDDLIASIWGGRIVWESTLTSRINAARKAVGDSGEDQKLIRTIARKGIRFVGAVRAQSNDGEPAQAGGPPPTELRARTRPALPPPDRPAIAVLPFINMSGDPEQEYFSDGISEDIITALSKLRWFFVIARNSSFIYKGKAAVNSWSRLKRTIPHDPDRGRHRTTPARPEHFLANVGRDGDPRRDEAAKAERTLTHGKSIAQLRLPCATFGTTAFAPERGLACPRDIRWRGPSALTSSCWWGSRSRRRD